MIMENNKRKPTRFYSSNMEKKVAKTLGGKTVPNSGAAKFVGGDITVNNLFLIECKTCIDEKKSFAIKREWLTKNKEEAFETGKDYSALCFNYGDNSENYYVIDERLFKMLVGYLQKEM